MARRGPAPCPARVRLGRAAPASLAACALLLPLLMVKTRENAARLLGSDDGSSRECVTYEDRSTGTPVLSSKYEMEKMFGGDIWSVRDRVVEEEDPYDPDVTLQKSGLRSEFPDLQERLNVNKLEAHKILKWGIIEQLLKYAPSKVAKRRAAITWLETEMKKKPPTIVNILAPVSCEYSCGFVFEYKDPKDAASTRFLYFSDLLAAVPCE